MTQISKWQIICLLGLSFLIAYKKINKVKKNIDHDMDNKGEESGQGSQVDDKSAATEHEEDKKVVENTTKEDKKRKGKKKSKSSKEDEYKAKAEEINDKYLRLYSEFDNYRRRTSKEKLELAKTASEDVIIDLLPVLDDFERAIKSAEETNDCQAVKEGMDLIFTKLHGILTRKGLKSIDSNEKEFDTDFHEAISYIPAPSEDLKGKVIDTVENGYTLNDKVIRYSKVVIGQ